MAGGSLAGVGPVPLMMDEIAAAVEGQALSFAAESCLLDVSH
jgi:hypothetical protein